jgi:serine/arginine repetitive matrix protein 2
MSGMNGSSLLFDRTNGHPRLLVDNNNMSSDLASQSVSTPQIDTTARLRVNDCRISPQEMKRNDTIIKEENDSTTPYPYSVENDALICQPSLFDTDNAPVYVNANVFRDEENIFTWRRYHALKDEAENTVIESKRLWEDTPFSVFTVQCKWYLILTP